MLQSRGFFLVQFLQFCAIVTMAPVPFESEQTINDFDFDHLAAYLVLM